MAYKYLLPLSAIILSCNPDGKKLYLLEELRVPVAQFWIKPSGAPTAEQMCRTFSGEIYCQQSPLRPAQAAGEKAYLTFVSIHTGTDAVKFELTRIKQLQNPLGGGRGPQQGVANQEIKPEKFGLNSLAPNAVTLNTLLQDSPLRVEQVGYELTLPTLQDLQNDFRTSGALPTYSFEYKAMVNEKSDRGSVSVYLLPSPAETAVWQSLSTLASPQAIEALKKQAVTNIPPSLGAISAAAEVSGEVNLEVANGTTADVDENAKKRVQWFVTQGELVNERSQKTLWKTKTPGPAGLFVMIRDLQGGVDFAFAKTVVK